MKTLVAILLVYAAAVPVVAAQTSGEFNTSAGGAASPKAAVSASPQTGVPPAVPAKTVGGASTSPSTSIDRQRAAAARQARTLAAPPVSLTAQRHSVERQMRQSVPASIPNATPLVPASDFYVVPWPDPPRFDPFRTSNISTNCVPLPLADRTALLSAGARHAALPMPLLRAVMEKESAFKPCAVSPVGAMGLMQLMPATADGLGVSDPFDPLQNVLAGSRFLRSLLDRYRGDLPLALGAYNAGPGRVDRAGGVPAIPETQQYVRDILSKLGAGPSSSGSSDWP